MRAISSLPVVGCLLPPINVSPEVGAGKIFAASNRAALWSIMHEGIVLPGNAPPGVIPARATPPGQFLNWIEAGPWAVVGSVIALVITAPVAVGYSLVSGTVTLKRPP